MNTNAFIETIAAVLADAERLPLEQRVEIANALSAALPRFLGLQEPVCAVQWVPAESVVGNTYNPNRVAPPEMRLLTLSMQEDGITMPVVVYREKDGRHTIVDGFHRTTVIKTDPVMRERTRGYIPVSVIDKPAENRMASTVRHNRARGEHGVEAMSNIVAQMREAGWTDAKIGRAMGMSADEVLRLQQITGLAALFAGQEFSRSWEIEETPDNDDGEGREAA